MPTPIGSWPRHGPDKLHSSTDRPLAQAGGLLRRRERRNLGGLDARGDRPGLVSLLLPRRRGDRRRVLRPLGLPLLHLVRLVRRRVELDQAVEGLGDARVASAPRWDRLLPLLQSLVALEEQRLGLGVLLLAQQRP